jgi:hypothetical protein
MFLFLYLLIYLKTLIKHNIRIIQLPFKIFLLLVQKIFQLSISNEKE